MTPRTNITPRLHPLKGVRVGMLTYSGAMDFKDGANQTSEYTYDANGNMSCDKNKGITSITYNVLNLPCEVAWADGHNTRYTYDANGRKLKVEYRLNNTQVVGPITGPSLLRAASVSAISSGAIDLPDQPVADTYTTLSVRNYCGNHIYQGDSLERVLTPVGYRLDGKNYYNITDNQGNVRVVIDQDGQIVETNNYYPYGGLMGTPAAEQTNPYKYSGKELDRESGLDLYDFSARYHDPFLTCFTTQDPLAEKYYSLSPYAYCAGNPIIRIDKTGKFIILVHGTWSNHTTWCDRQGIENACSILFNDDIMLSEGANFDWNGENSVNGRHGAATKLIQEIQHEMNSDLLSKDQKKVVTLVGHSHGGNVAIEAINRMLDSGGFDNVTFNLLTINTPVRDDYQLTDNNRVAHANVYDPKDPVQANGGQGNYGEIGNAKRMFRNAQNIKVTNPQSIKPKLDFWNIMDDVHNSHNRVFDWIEQCEPMRAKTNKLIAPK